MRQKLELNNCKKSIFVVFNLMTFCSVSLIALFVTALGIFIFRKPSKAELNKFEKEDQERFNWSKMGF